MAIMLPRRFQSILSKMLPCFPASVLLQRRPAPCPRDSDQCWCTCLVLPGAVVWCTCLLHLGPAPNLHKGLHNVHIAPNLLYLRLLHGLVRTMFIRRVDGMLMTAARCIELDSPNGLCTLCTAVPIMWTFPLHILALLFGILNIFFIKQTLYI